MGLDIHCYIEHSAQSDQTFWLSFGGRINPGRDYVMFGLLAGVRGDDDPIFPVRGMPEKTSVTTKWDNELFVSNEYPNGDRSCSLNDAERWVLEGCSSWIDERKVTVTDPDWHSHSWLTPDEWESVLSKAALRKRGEPGPEYYAMLAAMRCLESKGRNVRVVFWFDN